MNAEMGFVERRKQQRLKINEGAFAAIKSDIYAVGPIRNISRDGFAFRYVGKNEEMKGSLKVDLFYVGEGWCLSDLPSKTIHNLKIDKKAADNSAALRECGVQFGKLAENQMSDLDNFIQKYTHTLRES